MPSAINAMCIPAQWLNWIWQRYIDCPLAADKTPPFQFLIFHQLLSKS
ncbi:hypothetical protein KCP76_01140 [Salmonella enterica subsp. enterica serovar Weltevreden]|nr:hypothetical protein KCP76_01140 [Salmonella enterica subsp. enterica serovar Weltevreden]